MPCESASRGEANDCSCPSTSRVPSLWGCSPAMILIRVDFPAPLSPSTQETSPALTVRLMPFNARIAPYVLPTSRISISDSPLCRVSSACSAMVSVMALPNLSGGGELLDVQVHHHREQQHHTQEGAEPVGVPPGVDDAEAGHAEDEGADGDTDGVAVAAGQQRAAHDGGDDVEELVTHPVAGLQRVE